VRGSGESDKPGRRDAYRLAQLVDDLGAVLDAVSPARPVHLLAHDWGSIQAWAGVCDLRFATRVSSYTSMSGPSLDHAGQWMREAGRHPGATARQLLDSYYIGRRRPQQAGRRDHRGVQAVAAIGRYAPPLARQVAKVDLNKL